MATIQPFSAIRPSAALLRDLVFQDLENNGQQDIGLGHLKHKLEPASGKGHDRETLDRCIDYLQGLLSSGQYMAEEYPSVYIYETTQGAAAQTGVWTLTDLNDAERGRIITHEHTLSESEEQIKAYREHVGLEGTPILLTYHPRQDISDLIELIKTTHVPECFYYHQQYHRIWQVTMDSLISQFQDAFQKLGSVYVADGHHRLAAATALNKHTKQWISTLYIPTSDLKIKPFHRMVIPENKTLQESLAATVRKHYYVSAIPNNKPYRPDQMNRMGLYSDGVWHQLDLKKEIQTTLSVPDVLLLQEKILEPVYGITDPRTDAQLFSFPAEDGWDQLLTELVSHPEAVAFTLFPMTVKQLIEQAENHGSLPPKSTWIEPKIPFGILIYCSEPASHSVGIPDPLEKS
jgi:uncharacterized protein (DUF1015 family)